MSSSSDASSRQHGTINSVSASETTVTDVAARRGLFRRVADVVRYRELLGNLIRKELKV